VSAFIEGFMDAMRIACAMAGIATSCAMLIAAGMILRDGHIMSGAIFGAGSLWLLPHSVRHAWALLTNKNGKVTP
jgi:predicted branched-subunit amino acid permease